MVKFLIYRPIAVIMTFIAILVLGGVASWLLPVSLMPDIEIPEITIQVSRAGESVRQVENGIIRRLRQNLIQVPHLNDISSEARDGSALIKLRFDFGTDINYAFIDVNEQVDAAMRYLPDDMERPAIIKASATDLPVFYVNVYMEDSLCDDADFMEMCELSETIFKKRMEQLPQVAMVDVTGNVDQELFINPLPDKIKSLDVTHNDISDALKKNNVSLGSLEVIDGQYRFNIRFLNSLKNIEDVKNIYIRSGERVLQLKDVAKVGIRPKDKKGAFLSDKKLALSMAVIKQSDARMEDLKEEVALLLNIFKRDYPGLNFEIVRDQTALLSYSIANLRQGLIIGAFLAFIIMFFFLKDARSPWLIGFSIPVSIIVSILLFQLIGLTINIISLSGLILGVGMMIDNSIIVIDNITQHIERGKNLASSCIEGTNEVIRPLISSVLTTCAVFVPLIFLSGISGALFYDQAVAVAIGLIVSLVVSITLLPTLYRLIWLRIENKQKKTRGTFTDWLKKINIFRVEYLYEKGYAWVFSKRYHVFISFISLSLVALFLGIYLPKQRFPDLEQKELVLSIDWNEKINIEENIKRTRYLLDVNKTSTDLSNSYVGSQNFIMHKDMDLSIPESKIYFQVERSDQIKQLKNKLDKWITSRYPNASYTFGTPETIFERLFGDNEPPLIVKVRNLKAQGVPEIEKMNYILNELDGILPNEEILPVQTESFIEIRVNPELVALYNVDQSALYSRLKAAINSFHIGNLYSGSRYVPIVISDTKKNIEKILTELKITNSKGNEISVNMLINIKPVMDYKVVNGGKDGIYVPVNINKFNTDPMDFMDKLKDFFVTQHQLNIQLAGNWFSSRTLLKELLIVLLISLALLYFILAAQFESFLQPLIVLLEVPIDIAGALGLLWLFGGTINLMVMIGIVVMCGIIINDSILKIDTINRLRKNGNGLNEAIETAGKRRIKPIIMTSLTTILALVPFLWGTDMGSELQRPLALTVIGGMTLGTLVSLYFVPLCYYYLYKNKVKGFRNKEVSK